MRRDIEIGFDGGRSMPALVKDADRRAVILRKFYDERHIRSWVGFPAEPNATHEDKLITANICYQLDESGLIEWKTPGSDHDHRPIRSTPTMIEEIRFAGDSPLEEAVSSEPVSEAKFPASWENTGNFVRRGLRVRLLARNPASNSMVCEPIPYASEQGIYFGLAGN
jgi:hypothetical protein